MAQIFLKSGERHIMFFNKLHRIPFQLYSFVRYQTNIAPDAAAYKSTTEKKTTDQHLSNITVTSFYSQTSIEQYALKVFRNKVSPCFFPYSYVI